MPLVGSGIAQPEAACTITVHPGESIQAAIDAAPEGAVVCLPAGEWQGELTIRRSLTLRGAGTEKTTIRAQSQNVPVIQMHQPASLVVLEDLMVTGARGQRLCFGIIVNDAVVVRVSRCAISRNGFHGVVLLNQSQCVISGSAIEGNLGNGLVTYDSAHTLIVDSAVSNNGWNGITVEKEAEADLAGCTVAGNGRGTGGADCGVIVTDSASATITACTISENRLRGIGIAGEADAVVTGCRISKSTGAETGGDGIQLWKSAHAAIRNCVIFESGRHGIALKDSADADIRTCRVLLNGSYGVALVERPCFMLDAVFAGHVAGQGNVIPGIAEPDGNKLGAFCPRDLAFLATAEGGEFDRRPST